MSKNIIVEKSFDFALKVVGVYKKLEEKREYILSKQLLRSGTSIGANIREATHAESKADFIHKMAISQKEANESEYWIELLFRSEYITKEQYQSLMRDITEIRKILSSIIISSKENKRKP